MIERRLLSVEELSVDYRHRAGSGTVRAVQNVSFAMEAAASIGLVGESGSGKTTVALSLIGLLPANAHVAGGKIMYGEQDVSTLAEKDWQRLRWTKVGFIFQGGMNALNPVKRIVDQIVEPMLAHHTEASRSAATKRATELLERVGIQSSRANDYPHQLSGGMRQRVGIAMALACDPEIVIADEPVTAVDVVVQAQLIRLLADLRSSLGLALLVITHDLGVVAQLCNQVMVMYASEIVEHASVGDIFHSPKHPYTKLLLGSVPHFDGDRVIGAGIVGQPPSLASPPTGCRFHPRCPSVMPGCVNVAPSSRIVSDNHAVACHLYDL